MLGAYPVKWPLITFTPEIERFRPFGYFVDPAESTAAEEPNLPTHRVSR